MSRRAKGSHAVGATDVSVVRVPVSSQERGRIVIAGVAVMTTDVSGALTWSTSGLHYVSFNPLLAASPDMPPTILLWKEYAIRSVRFRFVPRNRYSKVTTNTGIFALGLDLTSNTPTPAYADAVTYSTTRLLSADDPAEVVFVIPQEASRIWYQLGIAGPTGAFFVSNPSTNLSASADLMDVVYEVELDLRGRA